jgi:hypothetical protein
VGRELPSDEVLASWQHVEQRALDLRAAGVPGALQELRVRAYLDLLQERDSRPGPGHEGSDPRSGGNDADPGSDGPESSGPGSSGPGSGSGSQAGPSLAALVNITVAWSTMTRRSLAPAEVDGLGLVDAGDAADLIAAAARDPRTRWCVTGLNPDGTAAAHGCATGRHAPPGTSSSGDSGPAAGPDPPSGVRPEDWLRVRMAGIARGTCAHSHAEAGYRPSRKLRHLVRARNAQCSAPGCGRPAVRCDLDHTLAWEQGGLTCECDLAPLCRHHHRCKQSEGWELEQPEPGVLVWRTPAGRRYVTRPTQYA